MSRKIIVIGAGPAGMMAAGAAAENGADVILFEKNHVVGRKLAITGKGRCNITNFCDTDEFIAHLTANPRFMYSAINQFSCYDTVAFFEERGLHTKVERGNRVFPESDKAADVVDCLYDWLEENRVRILNKEVKGLILNDGAVKGVRLNDREVFADAVIVTCGGLSYPATGSTGDGYTFAKSAGHTITPLLPSLVPLVSDDGDVPELQGLSLKNIAIHVFDNNSDKEIYDDFGEMLFTHFGVSGPVILSASAHMRQMSPNRYTIYIDLKPALDDDTLDKRILRDLSQKKGILVIMISHDLNIAAKYSDSMIMLSGGSIYAIGKPSDVITRENIKAVYGVESEIMESHGRPHLIMLDSEFDDKEMPLEEGVYVSEKLIQ